MRTGHPENASNRKTVLESLLALAKRILKGKSLKLPRERTLSSKLHKECIDEGRRNRSSGLKITESEDEIICAIC